MKSSGKYKIPNSKMALQDILKGDLSRVYLFLGEEEGEKDRFIALLAEKFLHKSHDTMKDAISVFHAQNGETMTAAAFALSSSMFDPVKICILTDIERIVLKAEQVAVSEMIRDLPDSTLLILSSGENQQPKFFTEAILSSVQAIVFWRLFESELQTHITQVFKEKGRIIDSGAVRRVVSLTGRDLRKVNNAIERILTGTDENPVTEKTVFSLIADEKEISIFELTDAIFKRRKDSLLLLKKVLEEGAADLQILALLEREAKRIELYHELKSHGLSHDDALSDLHLSPKAVEDFTIYIRMFPEPEIKKFMILMSKADYTAKSSSFSSSILSGPIAGLITETVRS
jgi:DNA polymerase III delta subunit